MNNVHPTMLAALRSFAPLANDQQPASVERAWAEHIEHEIKKPPEGGIDMSRGRWVCAACWTHKATRRKS